MLGVICDADSAKLNIDENEIEDARWFTRAEVCSVLFSDADAFELHRNKGDKKPRKDFNFLDAPPNLRSPTICCAIGWTNNEIIHPIIRIKKGTTWVPFEDGQARTI